MQCQWCGKDFPKNLRGHQLFCSKKPSPSAGQQAPTNVLHSQAERAPPALPSYQPQGFQDFDLDKILSQRAKLAMIKDMERGSQPQVPAQPSILEIVKIFSELKNAGSDVKTILELAREFAAMQAPQQGTDVADAAMLKFVEAIAPSMMQKQDGLGGGNVQVSPAPAAQNSGGGVVDFDYVLKIAAQKIQAMSNEEYQHFAEQAELMLDAEDKRRGINVEIVQTPSEQSAHAVPAKP